MIERSHLHANRCDDGLESASQATCDKDSVPTALTMHRRSGTDCVQLFKASKVKNISRILAVYLGLSFFTHEAQSTDRDGLFRNCETLILSAGTRHPDLSSSLQDRHDKAVRFAGDAIDSRLAPTADDFQSHLAVHVIDSIYRGSDKSFYGIADAFQRVAMKQVEAAAKLVNGLSKWRENSSRAPTTLVNVDHTTEVTWDDGSGEKTHSVPTWLVNTEALSQLMANARNEWTQLEGISPEWLNFFGNPFNKDAVKRLMVRYLEAKQKAELSGKQLPKSFKDPRELSFLDLAKEVIKLRVHEITLEHLRQAMSEGRMVAQTTFAQARQASSQATEQFICDAATRCMQDIVAMAEALERLIPLDLIAFVEGREAAKLADQPMGEPADRIGRKKQKVQLVMADFREMVAQMRAQAEEKGRRLIPSVSGEHGALVLKLPQYQASIVYDPRLATLVVQSSQGRFPQAKGPLVFLDHGIGTNQSNAPSWLNVFAKFANYLSGNLLAPDGIRSGMGMRFRDPDYATLAGYAAQHTDRVWQQMVEQVGERMVLVDNEPYAPVVQIGRSYGSTKALFHDYVVPFHRVDVRVLTAFSNPETLEDQIRHVEEEARLGMIQGLDMDILQFMTIASDDFLEALDRTDQESVLARQLFSLAQMSNVYLVSRSDEDGGEDVLAQHTAFARLRTPYAHNFFLADPLRGTSFADAHWPGYLSWFSLLESKHYIANPNPNVSPELGAVLFPDLPMELLPKLENQLKQTATLTYAMMDWQIAMESIFRQAATHTWEEQPQVSRMFLHLAERARRLRLYREQYLPGGVTSFFDAMAFANNISAEDLVKARNERQDFKETRKQIRTEFIAFERALDKYIRQHTGLSRRDLIELTIAGALYKFESINAELIDKEPSLATLIKTFTGMEWEDFAGLGKDYHHRTYDRLHQSVKDAEDQLRKVHIETSSGMSWQDYTHLDLAHRFDMIRLFVKSEQVRVTKRLKEDDYLPRAFPAN